MSQEQVAADALAELGGASPNETPSEGEDKGGKDDKKTEESRSTSQGETDDATEAAGAEDSSSQPKTVEKPARVKRKYKKRQKEPVHHYPEPPRIVKVVTKPRTFVNHSYNDFSSVSPEPEYKSVWDIEKMSFAQKIHHMLSDERNSHCITWMPHGRAFKILVPKFLETEVLPRYVGHSRYSRFLTQLRTAGFKSITQGIDQSCYYHECFLRGRPHLCKYMPVHELDPRRKMPDPENEPDFYAISRMYPLEPRGRARAASGVSAGEMTAMGWHSAAAAQQYSNQPVHPHQPMAARPFPATGLHSQMSLQPSASMPMRPFHDEAASHHAQELTPPMVRGSGGPESDTANVPLPPQQWVEEEEAAIARLQGAHKFKGMDTMLTLPWQHHTPTPPETQQFKAIPAEQSFANIASYPPAAPHDLPESFVPMQQHGQQFPQVQGTKAVAHSLLERNISDPAQIDPRMPAYARDQPGYHHQIGHPPLQHPPGGYYGHGHGHGSGLPPHSQQQQFHPSAAVGLPLQQQQGQHLQQQQVHLSDLAPEHLQQPSHGGFQQQSGYPAYSQQQQQQQQQQFHGQPPGGVPPYSRGQHGVQRHASAAVGLPPPHIQQQQHHHHQQQGHFQPGHPSSLMQQQHEQGHSSGQESSPHRQGPRRGHSSHGHHLG